MTAEQPELPPPALGVDVRDALDRMCRMGRSTAIYVDPDPQPSLTRWQTHTVEDLNEPPPPSAYRTAIAHPDSRA